MKVKSLILLSSLIIGGWSLRAQKLLYPTVHVEEWEEMNKSKQETMDWFQDAKFGMFIHWGIYSIPGGIWNGQKIHTMRRPHVAEWIQHAAMVPRDEYAQLAKSFNPFLFDADAIAGLAKAAGMKYLVVGAKHHDGFAMFDSKVSEFDVMDATPFKRDIIKELYEACKKQGIEFGVYYSHNIDWADGSDCRVAEYEEKGWKIDHKLQAFGANTWDPSPNTFQEYLDNKAYPQVRELMENYPDMKCLWYDMPWRMDAEQSFSFYKLVYNIQPQIIITDRVGNGFGDYSIPGDNKIPANPDEMVKPWETVGTFNNSWGFNGYDQDWKSPKEILFWLIEIVSKGGNYMLNIGPTALGAVPAESVNNLETVGKWMDINGEALYGTTKWEITNEGPTKLEMGGTNAREKHGFNIDFTSQDFWFTQKGNLLYAIAMEYPEDKVLIKSLCKDKVGVIKNVNMLGCQSEFKWKQTGEGLEVNIGKERADKNGYVLKIGL